MCITPFDLLIVDDCSRPHFRLLRARPCSSERITSAKPPQDESLTTISVTTIRQGGEQPCRRTSDGTNGTYENGPISPRGPISPIRCAAQRNALRFVRLSGFSGDLSLQR